MRCQYRELPLNSGGSSTFVHLEMDLLPWTDAKRTLIASTIRSEFLTGDQHVQFHRYLTAGRAVVEFQRSTGAWPTEANAPQIKASADREAHAFVDQMCKGGLGSVPETIELIGRLISADALKILTGSGHPINNVNVEEAILIATAQ
ncbi:hypothetical protein SEUCBS140593_007037 [Sporothrix eucalyptigena]|uniref:Uncharacterized protein n=1 Tax=Sporothrix eucalyptigena TaxID=1812306 RepID=A0ABP0CAZ8_9PEZI